MQNSTTDVVIIGAGAAGLAAAEELARGKIAAVVLEARDRIGGRCYTRATSGLSVPIELGAEFIHGRSPSIFSALKRHSIAAVDTVGPHWFETNGTLQVRNSPLPEIRAAMRKPHTLHAGDMSFDKFLDTHLSRELSADALAYARTMVEGYDGADASRISALEVVDEWSGGGAADSASFRPLGGYGALMASMATALNERPVRVQLETVVRAIRWKRGRVEVSGNWRGRPFTITGSRAIVTLPLGVLQLPAASPHAVQFSPALADKRAALKKISSGSAVKVVLWFRRAFWEQLERGRFRDAAFFHSTGAAFRTFWTVLPIRAPVLTVWAGGPRADALSARGEKHMIKTSLASLESLFGRSAEVAKHLAGACVHDWRRDPYTCGAYSYVTTGGQGARETLAKPLRDTLFFAGEAADLSGEASTVGGALQSGITAARLVVKNNR